MRNNLPMAMAILAIGFLSLQVSPTFAQAGSHYDLSPLDRNLNSIDSWTVDSGSWTPIANGFQGTGDSEIRFNQALPANVHLSLTIKPIEGKRVRMYFEGPDIMVGNEYDPTTLAVYAWALGDAASQKVPYRNGDSIKISVTFTSNHYELHINDTILGGDCVKHDAVRLRFRAGDGASPGTTEFSDFLIDSTDPLPAAPPIAKSDQTPAPAAAADAGKPGRLQTAIHALYVREEDSGEMLGISSELILTAIPGTSPNPPPVAFSSEAGKEMLMVLDDVLRYTRMRFSTWNASKIDLSFQDKYTPKDGGSIGAAIGTLIFSSLQGFDIDPDLAITGDVTADGKIGPIGGLAAKIRGATAAGCKIVAAPLDNYDQVVDAFVYEGAPLITNVQIIGIADLDEAAAVARVDRPANLKEAIDTFADVQDVLQKNPKLITSKDVADKLAHVLDLEPNHFSAKLLLLTSQGKQPKKLSASATEYYANVAVQTMLPSVMDKDKKVEIHVGTPAEMQEGLRKIQKVRWYANPRLLTYVVATQDFMQAAVDDQNGRVDDDYVQAKAQAVLDESAKLTTDRDLMEKMLHEGI